MASELHVDTIKHSGGTSALTIDSSGNVHKAGLCVQTVDFTYNSPVTTASNSNVSTGISVNFTPKFNNSKIYASCFISFKIQGTHDHGLGFTLTRTISGTSTTIYTPNQSYEVYQYDGSAGGTAHDTRGRVPMFVVDTPNTTSQCTYEWFYKSMRTTDYSNSVSVQQDSVHSHGYIMEIAQ